MAIAAALIVAPLFLLALYRGEVKSFVFLLWAALSAFGCMMLAVKMLNPPDISENSFLVGLFRLDLSFIAVVGLIGIAYLFQLYSAYIFLDYFFPEPAPVLPVATSSMPGY